MSFYLARPVCRYRPRARAQVETALRAARAKATKLRITDWVSIAASGRKLELVEDREALAEASKLDGYYVLKTDLDLQAASKEIVHERDKDLSQVEWAFRTSKSVYMETLPSEGIAVTTRKKLPSRRTSR